MGFINNLSNLTPAPEELDAGDFKFFAARLHPGTNYRRKIADKE